MALVLVGQRIDKLREVGRAKFEVLPMAGDDVRRLTILGWKKVRVS
jgi:hypothetical protein